MFKKQRAAELSEVKHLQELIQKEKEDRVTKKLAERDVQAVIKQENEVEKQKRVEAKLADKLYAKKLQDENIKELDRREK